MIFRYKAVVTAEMNVEADSKEEADQRVAEFRERAVNSLAIAGGCRSVAFQHEPVGGAREKIENCKLQNANCKIHGPHPPFPNPHSPTPN